MLATKLVSKAVTVLSVLVLCVPVMTNAQSEIPTASPQPVIVELSGSEPGSTQVKAVMDWGGWGGGGEEKTPSSLYWALTPNLTISQRSWFIACGYPSGKQPQAVLTNPDGSTKDVVGTNARELPEVEESDPLKAQGMWSGISLYVGKTAKASMIGTCWAYHVPWEWGMQLGVYQLHLKHAAGQLTYTWAMDYPLSDSPLCTRAISQNVESRQLEDFIVGLPSSQSLKIEFYTMSAKAQDLSIDISYRKIAERPVRSDADGTLFLKINVGASAPFRIISSNGEIGLVYRIFNAQGHMIYSRFPSDTLGVYPRYSSNGDLTYESYGAPQPFGEPNLDPENQVYIPPLHYIQPKYPTYQVEMYPSCNGDVGRLAISPTGKDLYKTAGSNQTVGALAANEPFVVLESSILQRDGKVEHWHHIRLEKGLDAWTFGNDFRAVSVKPIPGMSAEVAPNNKQGAKVFAPTIQTYPWTPDKYKVIKTIQPKARLTVISAGLFSTLVRTQDNVLGWVEPGKITMLPWKPVSLKTTAACPKAPTQRLFVGDIGAVTPGPANNLRNAPENGGVVGKMPGGSSFIVVGGPECGKKNGLRWWQVLYQSQIGWTPEGQANEYWLEPKGN